MSEATRCFMFQYPGTPVIGVDDDERNATEIADGGLLTPAVAIPMDDYQKAREIIAIMAVSSVEARAALSLLPEVV